MAQGEQISAQPTLPRQGACGARPKPPGHGRQKSCPQIRLGLLLFYCMCCLGISTTDREGVTPPCL